MRLRRLSHQIYLTIIIILIVVVGLASVAWRVALNRGPTAEAFGVAAEFAAAAVPGPDAPLSEQKDAIRQLSRKLDIDMALFNEMRELIVQSGDRSVLPPTRFQDESGFMFRRRKFAWALQLPDGRWLVSQSRRRGPPRPGLRLIFFLGVVALIVGLCAWPVVRGLTRRLETLQTGVEKLGRGDLGARVDVQGRDEIAALANSFNSSAERIETLVASHRLLLANASHELRTPLARIRLALELIQDETNPRVRSELEKDIGELDEMIEEILLLSRLDAGVRSDVREDVDLLALVAEEAARYTDCDLDGVPTLMRGDPQLLRRLIRNLLENAKRHGKAPIEVKLDRVPGSSSVARLSVTDHGPGLGSEDAERVFEPFHRGSSRGRERGSGLGLALVRQIAAQHNGTAAFAPGIDGRINRVVVTLAI
ncbi:MAG: ATP-binding protein [Pseudomonadota bacterium]